MEYSTIDRGAISVLLYPNLLLGLHINESAVLGDILSLSLSRGLSNDIVVLLFREGGFEVATCAIYCKRRVHKG
jgi:hypothetical protein